MKFLKWLGLFVVLLGVGFASVLVAAKFSDGPIGPFPGGPLVAGELKESPVADWSFANNAGEVELQLTQDTSSRTTWLAVVNNNAYVSAALGFPPNKSWHLRAQQEGSALIRIDGARFPVDLNRIDSNSAEFAEVVDFLDANGAMPPGGREQLWIFRASSR